MATIGERIKTLRTASNLNQEEFGKQFGLVKSTVSLYENGKSTPDDETKKKICEKYNVSMDWLYGLTVDYLLGTERSEKQEGVMMNLRKLRERAGLSQEELAKKLKISQKSISKYERGDRRPSYEVLLTMSSIFGVSVDYLLGLEDARSKKLQMGESEKEDLQKIITDLCQITQNLKAWIERNL